MVEKQEKRYVSDNAQLMAEWNWEKNNELEFNPEMLTLGSNKKAWWKCSEGHEWQAAIANRNYGNGCPYCSGRYVVKGENDLQTINPTLAKEWNYEKNNGLTPLDVLPNSGNRVWWKCINGHDWKDSIAHRNNGRGCPYCSGQRLLKGYNDLQTVNPTLAIEWNYERNGNLKPDSVTANNGKKVWWKCNKGHEWQAKIYHRNNGSGCPVCYSERNTSLPEFALFYYLKTLGIEVVHSYKELGYELDIYIPSKKTAIEFDGYYWHKNKAQKDKKKNRQCEKDGIKLYRIREGLPPLCDSSIDFVIQKDQKKDLSKVIAKVINKIVGISVNVDLARDAIAIENLREYTEKENSILFSNPEIAKEWNYEKNGNLKPEHFLANSNKKVWWKCIKGHEWQAIIQNRNKGIGCPYCSGRYAIKGKSDLQTVNPDLAKEWNYEKNNGLTPMDVLPNSEQLVWWKCQKGHEWQAMIGNRNRGSGCPYCSGRYPIKGENDLQTVNPNLAKEWNEEKNNGLTPKDVLPNSNKKVWWKCNKGHEWQAVISHRNKGSGCPYCSGKKILLGYNDLATKNPNLALEWHPIKNGDLLPTMVSLGSNKKVWWICNNGHEWQATIYDRNSGRGCPICRKSNHNQN